jgi:protein-S-isoprenylcysteine O-methyltransferase Ste14
MDTKGFFISLFVGTLVIAGLYLLCVNPEVVVARIRFHRGTKRWDRILLCFLLPAACAVFLVAALDNGQFHWLPVPWWVRSIGYGLFRSR